MSKLSHETSFVCSLFVQPDGTTGAAPSPEPCNGFLVCKEVLPFNPELNGKLQHRICNRCGSPVDTLTTIIGFQTPGRIDTAKADDRPSLFSVEDYALNE